MQKRIVTITGDKFDYLKKCETDLYTARVEVAEKNAEYEDFVLVVAALIGGAE